MLVSMYAVCSGVQPLHMPDVQFWPGNIAAVLLVSASMLTSGAMYSGVPHSVLHRLSLCTSEGRH
jgi:hypothetical protein